MSLAVIVPRPTRRQLLLRGAAAAGAGAAIAMPAPPARAAGPSVRTPDPPDERLRRLLRVELLLLYCYEHVLGTAVASERARPVLALQAHHEQAHVSALAAELTRLSPAGPVPAGPVSTQAADHDLARRNVRGRLGGLQGEKDALHLLLDVERVVTGAYFVALIKLEDRRLIALAVSIMAAEAQHEALIGDLLYPGHADQSVPYGLIQGSQ